MGVEIKYDIRNFGNMDDGSKFMGIFRSGFRWW